MLAVFTGQFLPFNGHRGHDCSIENDDVWFPGSLSCGSSDETRLKVVDQNAANCVAIWQHMTVKVSRVFGRLGELKYIAHTWQKRSNEAGMVLVQVIITNNNRDYDG